MVPSAAVPVRAWPVPAPCAVEVPDGPLGDLVRATLALSRSRGLGLSLGNNFIHRLFTPPTSTTYLTASHASGLHA